MNFLAACENWPLISLIVQEEGFGRKVPNIVPLTPQQLPNAPSPSSLVSMVTQYTGELETKLVTYNERSKLHCHVKGSLKKFIQACNM